MSLKTRGCKISILKNLTKAARKTSSIGRCGCAQISLNIIQFVTLFYLLQAFFLTVVVVATVIYLGVARDYFSLSQYAALTPKQDISVQGELE